MLRWPLFFIFFLNLVWDEVPEFVKFIPYRDRSSALRLYVPSNLKYRVVKFNPDWPIFWPAERFYVCIVWFTLRERLRLKLVGTKWTSQSNEYFKGERSGREKIKCACPKQDIKIVYREGYGKIFLLHTWRKTKVSETFNTPFFTRPILRL